MGRNISGECQQIWSFVDDSDSAVANNVSVETPIYAIRQMVLDVCEFETLGYIHFAAGGCGQGSYKPLEPRVVTGVGLQPYVT